MDLSNPLQALHDQIKETQGRLNALAASLSQTDSKGAQVGRSFFNVTSGWWPCTVSTEFEVKLLKEPPSDCLKVNFDPSEGVKIDRTAISKVKSVTRVKYGIPESQYECIVVTKESEKIRFICPHSEMIRKLFVLFEQPTTCRLFGLRERRIAYITDYDRRKEIALVTQLKDELHKAFNIDLQFEPKEAKPPYPLFFISKVWGNIKDSSTIARCSDEINQRSGGNGVWLLDIYTISVSISLYQEFPKSGLFMNNPDKMIPAVLTIDQGQKDNYDPQKIKELAHEMGRLIDLAYERGEK